MSPNPEGIVPVCLYTADAVSALVGGASYAFMVGAALACAAGSLFGGALYQVARVVRVRFLSRHRRSAR